MAFFSEGRERERETDRQTDRQAVRQRERERERERDRQTDRQTDRQPPSLTDTDTERYLGSERVAVYEYETEGEERRVQRKGREIKREGGRKRQKTKKDGLYW